MKQLLASLLTLLMTCAFAQQRTRPATDSDFVGYWRIQLVPDEVHGSPVKNDMTAYSGACRHFIHMADGSWFNLSTESLAGAVETKRHCLELKRSDIEAQLFSVQNVTPYKWKKYRDRVGFYQISDGGPKGVIWKVEYMMIDIPESISRGYDLKAGDLLMELVTPTATELRGVWPVILRPVSR